MKIIVRNARYKRWSGEPIKFEDFEIDCEGTGTKDDPIIIDSSSMFPKGNIEIIESKLYIIIENCDVDLLSLKYCKNILIRTCKFGSLMMVNCSDISIENTHSSWIRWYKNRNCLVKDSVSEEEIILYNCSNNIFKNCEFWNFFTFEEDYSRGNKFENIDFSNTFLVQGEDAFKKIQKPASKSGNTFSIGNYTRKDSYISEEVECSGSGTKENPFIVDNQKIREHNLKKIRLFGSRDYVIFKNFNLKQLKLYDTQHITIESCAFSKSCLLKFCSDMKMNFVSIKKLKFGACNDTIIANSDIEKIEVYEGYIPESSKLKRINIYEGYGKITLRNCSYKKIKKIALQAIEIK